MEPAAMSQTKVDRQSAEYVADMARQLAAIAEEAGLETVARMLVVAQAETEKALFIQNHCLT
jgi:hypothetical protein